MHFISTSDLLGPEWRFLEPVCTNPALTWETRSGRPQGFLERHIRRPALARYRAAFQAALAARRRADAALVSHLPLMSAATNLMRRRLCPAAPHVAFAFNFTDLPEGAKLRYLRQALCGIDEFVVFSRFEQPLYAERLSIPEDRIRFLPWAMEPPVAGPGNPAAGLGPYLCAIGGEGRDYALLAEVMRQRPALRMVIVARPYSIAGIVFPPNVTVFTNLPAPATWRIAADSQGLVIPLKTETTACGHITLVGAQLLGIPLVISGSVGVRDYVTDGVTARVVPVGAAAPLLAALDAVAADPAATARMAAAALAQAAEHCTLQSWVRYFEGLAERLPARSRP